MKKSQLALTAVLGLGAMIAAPAGARTFTVNDKADFGVSGDGKCHIKEALEAVNAGTNGGSSGCVPVNDVSYDRVRIPAGRYPGIQTFTIERSVVIEGDGIGRTIVANRSIIAWEVHSFPHSPTVTFERMTLEGFQQDNLGMNVYSSLTDVNDEQPWVAYVFLDQVRMTNFGLSALFNNGGVVQLQYCVFDNNIGDGGGAIRNYGFTTFGGYMYIYGSTINGNRATDVEGGAIYNAGSLSIWGSTISGNIAQTKGGGIYTGQRRIYKDQDNGNAHANDAPRPYLELSQTTIASNQGSDGGGVYFEPSVPGLSASSMHVLVANNTGGTRPDYVGPLGSQAVPGFPNLVRNASGTTGLEAGSDLTGLDPRLAALGSYGGPLRTHYPRVGSAAIDAGDESNESQDQRGFLRPVDGGIGRGAAYDIGAVEYDPVWQLERLGVANSSGDAHTLVYPNGDGANGWTRYASNADGDYVTYALPIPEDASYEIRVRMVRHPDAGIYQVSTATSSGGTYSNLGSTKDCYASSRTTTETTIGTRSFTAGTRYIRFRVTGKNGSSSNRRLYFDGVRLIKK